MLSVSTVKTVLKRWETSQELLLRSRTLDFSDPRLRDVGTCVVALVLIFLAISENYRTGLVSSYAWSAAAGAAFALTLLLRRQATWLVGGTSVLATLVTDDTTPLIFSTWALARYAQRTRLAAITSVALGYYMTRPLLGQSPFSRAVLYQLAVYVVLTALVAQLLRRQEQLNALCWQQVRQIRGTVDQATKYAVLEERTRLAFDMHDGIGHQMAVVTLQAAAVKLNAGEPERVREGADAIESASRTVMAELREILNILHEDLGDASPPARLVEAGYQVFLQSLVRNMSAIGVDAVYSVDGTPFPLPQQIQSVLYRIGQEGLTNAVKHAPGADIEITLTFRQHWVGMCVQNGPPVGKGPSLGGTGTGLQSLRARVERLDGGFHARPTSEGGFQLGTRMPLPTPTPGPA